MCGAHRRDVLRAIRTRLAAGEPCRVVSTQLVEAGVDLDFPVVFRAIGPLDRIAQAAGRCNREGRLPDKGRVVVFSIGDDVMPSGAYRHGADVTRGMQREGTIDLRDPATFDRYFRQLYADRHADERGIQRYRAGRAYEEVAERFRMIDDDTFPVFVNYGEVATAARDAVHRAADRSGSAVRRAFRGIQPFIVSCRIREQGRFESLGLIEETLPGFWEWHGQYDEKIGLMNDRIDPVRLFI
jgi:CRISPR-associated endonuclease/helicase Cas3